MINLPPLEIPALQLPMQIPELVHPAVVHFAIVLPIIILLIELFNTLFKKKALSVTSLLLILLLTVISFASYLTGSVDGKNAYDLLSPEGQALLKEHKLIGTYLVYGSAVVLLFKMISMVMNAGFIRLLFVLLLIGFTGSTLYQGKEGGELVYKYASNVAPVAELDSEVFDLKEEIEESEEENKAKIKELEDKISTLTNSSKDGSVLKAENDKLKIQIDTLEKKVKETENSLETQIETFKTKAQETKDSLEAQIATLKEKAVDIVASTKEKAESVVEAVVTTITPDTTDTNSSAE